MKKFLIIIFPLFLVVSCKMLPESIPSGTWNYDLLINGAKIGSAKTMNKIENNNLVSVLEMKMNAGQVKNITKQIITETKYYKPVKFEVYNSVINNGQEKKINTVAVFNSNTVDLDTGYSRGKIKLDRSFVLEGGYFLDKLIKKKFKKGTIIKSRIYDPTIEIEETIPVSVEVMGRKKISINGKTKELIHIVESIQKMKTIDIFIDNNGVTQIVIVKMLNNTFELIIKE